MKAAREAFRKVMSECGHLVQGDPGSCSECEEKALNAALAVQRQAHSKIADDQYMSSACDNCCGDTIADRIREPEEA